MENGLIHHFRLKSAFVSATFAAHLAGELYVPIIKERSNFSLQMSISGNAYGTGKSLFQTLWTRAFKGKSEDPVGSCTEAQAYVKLDAGENIYGENFHLLELLVYVEVGQCQEVELSSFYSGQIGSWGWECLNCERHTN